MPGLQRHGDEWHGPCPACGGDDRFRVLPDGSAFCRQCAPAGGKPFADLLRAAGLADDDGRQFERDTADAAGSNGHAQPVTRLPAPDTTPPSTARYEIRNPAGELVAAHCRTDPGKRIWWEPKGVKANALPLYRIEHVRTSTGPVVITEGEKAADALAAAAERDLLIVGTVTGATSTPNASALEPLVEHVRQHGVPIYLWPDADQPGSTHMQRIGTALVEAGGPTPRLIDWEAAPPKGDAADWAASGQPALVSLLESAKPFDADGAKKITDTDAGPRRPTRSARSAPEVSMLMAPDLQPTTMWVPGRGWFVRKSEHALWEMVDSTSVSSICRDHPAWWTASSGTRTSAILEELRDQITVPAEQLDADDWEAGLPDGSIVNLRNGMSRQAKASDHITMALRVMPAEGEPELWLRILRETFSSCDDIEATIGYLRWWFWRSLVGQVNDVVAMLFLFGLSGSGKSTVADTMLWIAGDYGVAVAAEHVVGDSHHHRAWIARLDRKRFVRIVEMPDKGEWKTADMNPLIGGEPVTANHMRGESFDFRSRATICTTGNHAPHAGGASGIWRRLRLIDCRNKVPDQKQDMDLMSKLQGEAGKILRWTLDAAGQDRPIVPSEMCMDLKAMQEESDPLGQWLNEHYVADRNGTMANGDLWEAYCRDFDKEDRLGQRRFNTCLTEVFGASVRSTIGGDTQRRRRCRLRSLQ